jgi:CPA1 family monovalent cation:H+ antiporter
VELTLALGAAALLVVAGAAALGPRVKVPAPVLLVLIGIGVSLLPFVDAIVVAPEWVLIGVLPPLLYSASVSLPATTFRREFGAISGLSVVLVLLTAVVLGLLFVWLIPGLGFWWGVALGAVVSPTDAVATAIVKGTAVSHRVTAILEGESLLNDASALVLLRTAVLGTAATVTFWGVLGDFAYAVVVALVIGLVVGHLTLLVRSRVTQPAVGTVLSFTVPFLASIPAEVLHASGLVAAVAAGLSVGRHAARRLSPQQRISDEQNWQTVSLVLEGAVFLLMGLQIFAILQDAHHGTDGGGAAALQALGIGAAALVVTLLVRAAFVVPLLAVLGGRGRLGERSRVRVERMQQAAEQGDPTVVGRSGRQRPVRTMDLDRFTRRVRQVLADLDYLAASPLGPREGAVVVWAGMRGAITVAAAQTLPEGVDAPPHRALLVLVAFAAAALSLVLQGGTLGLVIRWLKPAGDDPAAEETEHDEVMGLLKRTAEQVPTVEGESRKERRLRQIVAQRNALLDARDLGVFGADILVSALASLDAAQIALELQGGPRG